MKNWSCHSSPAKRCQHNWNSFAGSLRKTAKGSAARRGDCPQLGQSCGDTARGSGGGLCSSWLHVVGNSRALALQAVNLALFTHTKFSSVFKEVALLILLTFFFPFQGRYRPLKKKKTHTHTQTAKLRALSQ